MYEWVEDDGMSSSCSLKKNKDELDVDMNIQNTFKPPVYAGFFADLLMCVTKYKVCDTHECYII